MTVHRDAGVVVAKATPSLLCRAERWGLALLLIGVAALAWSGWYVGRPMPDPAVDSHMRVLTVLMNDDTSLAAEPDRELIRAGKLKPVATRWLWTGTLRTFAVYRASEAVVMDVDAAAASGLEELKAWERRRGYALLPDEQPVKIGSILFAEAGPRHFTTAGWTHIKHSYDAARLFVAAVVGCLALSAYVALRLTVALVAAAFAFIATGAIPSWAARFED